MSCNKYRKCCVCGVTAMQDTTIPFHRFPKAGKSNLLRLRAWAKYCWPEEEWLSVADLAKLNRTSKVICGKHFELSAYIDSNRKRLTNTSIPGDTEFVSNMLPKLRQEMHLIIEDSAFQLTSDLLRTSDQQRILSMPTTSRQQTTEQLTFDLSRTSDQQHILSMPTTSRQQTTEQLTFDLSRTSDQQHILSMPTTSQQTIEQVQISENVKEGELSPRKKKLLRICKNKVRAICRLKNKLKLVKKSSRIKTLTEDENLQKLLDLNLTNDFIILLQSQIKNCPKKLKGRRYTLEDKILALSMYKKSPGHYRMLRRICALPCQSTLNNLLNKVPLQPGINAQLFAGLSNMVKCQLPADNICILSFDEMAIRKHISYNKKMDYMNGYQDHGSNYGRSNEVASNALVFMVAGVRKKWKQPVSFYFSAKTVKSDRLAVLIKEVLEECFKIGLVVVGTVCDLSRVNIKALEILGSSIERPYFTYSDHEVVTILDPPHLLKCFRNLFLKHDVEMIVDVQSGNTDTKGIAKWSHIRQFYEMDKINPNFIYAPALTESHLNPNIKQKMRVKLAAQIFSHSVTAGILAKISSNELPAEAVATATFLNKMDYLFDAVNADTADRRGGKKFSTNMTLHSPHMELFREMKIFINSIKFLGSRTNPPSQAGWIRTMNAVEKIFLNLNTMGINSLSTRRLNQDVLENCFGCIRYSCGSNANPNIDQFIAAIKTSIISSLRHAGRARNCEEDSAIVADNLKEFLKSTEVEKSTESVEDHTDNVYVELDSVLTAIADATEVVEQASSEAQACAYVCGFIIKKQKITCSTCKEMFLVENIEPIHIFTDFREYNTLHRSLKYVNKTMVQCVETCANLINIFLKTQSWVNNIKFKILTILNTEVDFSFLKGCEEHFSRNKEHIIQSCFYICIKRFSVVENRNLIEDETKRKLKRKLNLLKNK